MTPDFTQTTKPCEDCHGSGRRVYAVRTYGGRWTGEEEERDCERCHGEGRVTVEVHEACGLDENSCRCFDEVEEKAA